MVYNSLALDVFFHGNCFCHYSLNLNDLGYFFHHLNYLLNHLFHLFYYLYSLLSLYYHFFYQLNNLWSRNLHNFLRTLNLNYFSDLFFQWHHFFDFNDFRSFDNSFNNILMYLMDFLYIVNDLRDLNKLFLNEVFYYWLLEWYISCVLNNIISLDLYRVFLSCFSCDIFGDFYNFLHHFLNNFLHFDDLWYCPINSENIINIYNVHNLITNHPYNSLVNFWCYSSLSFHFLHLLKKGFD